MTFYDFFPASLYEIVYGRDITKVLRGTGSRRTDISQPDFAGRQSNHTLNQWHDLDQVFYVVIRAVSRVGRPGPWSVPARLFMPSPATTTEINTRGSTQAGTIYGAIGNLEAPRKRDTLTTRDLLAIVGAACGFLLIVLILSIYYVVVVTRRRKRKEQKIKEPEVIPPAEPDSETDSITKQPTEEAPMTDTNKEPRPLSPVQSWPASRLLNEHERRRPPDAVQGECHNNPPPDLGIPTNPHPFLYHTMNGRYIEDNIPFDGGSIVSTQPSDSMLVYRLDTGATETARPGSTTAWDGRPVIAPNVASQHHIQHDPHSTATLPHDRRRRNVTQV